MLAVIAGQGALPGLVHDARPDAAIYAMEGSAPDVAGPVQKFRIEQLGTLFLELSGLGVTQVCFAGAVHRPVLDPSAIDAATLPLASQIQSALSKGDDATLSAAIAMFEDAGFQVVAAQELRPDLCPGEGLLTRAVPSENDRKDAARAADLISAIDEQDFGQGCVVASGHVLAVEAFGGTDWMLQSLAGNRPAHWPAGGLLFKAAKPGQDRRIDLPAIGPGSVVAANAAGLAGIVVEAGSVLVLDQEAMIEAADAAGIFIWVRGS